MEKFDVSEIYGINVFGDKVMRERLPKNIYKELKKTIKTGEPLAADIADVVANAMKDWAIERGATHYTHWFQPMTGITAEKHEAFVSPVGEGKAIAEFSGKELIKGEADASSFPSGGLRIIFEARGYNIWDCTSPAFLKEDASGLILCVPTIFCAYTGEALDKKTPLLRSITALNKPALRLLRLFGDNETMSINTSVGPEQEYFLIDKDMYKKRDDIKFTGHTLFGALPPKSQELDDHYYGVLKERVSCFMAELNEEMWKLGIPAKTKHNEVAPCQHELAPIYENANIATDHNQLMMEYMKKIAGHYNLYCMLHEKPFEGTNGSGKHNNWSICTDTGRNLLDPGKNPHENKEFLLFLVAVIKAVNLHSDLLRLSASNVGNDYRLGGNEAPPSIISIFLGTQLEDILDQIENDHLSNSIQGENMELGVKTLPLFEKDVTDRNRTSPFAFTGNKFEFRMLGSSDSIGCTNYMLNTMVADVLEEFANELEGAKDFDKAVMELIKKTIKENKRIIFNGNGYSCDWVVEAEKRGIPNIRSMVEAIPSMIKEDTVALFERHGVLSKTECEARADILYDEYINQVRIEAKTMIEMAEKQIEPAVFGYTKTLADTVNTITNAGGNAKIAKKHLDAVTEKLDEMDDALEKLKAAVEKVDAIEDKQEKAVAYREDVFFAMADLRKPADELEKMVDKKVWPFPTYGDMFFYED